MLDPIVHTDSMHTDHREKDMQRVTVTFYGTAVEAEELADHLRHYTDAFVGLSTWNAKPAKCDRSKLDHA